MSIVGVSYSYCSCSEVGDEATCIQYQEMPQCACVLCVHVHNKLTEIEKWYVTGMITLE